MLNSDGSDKYITYPELSQQLDYLLYFDEKIKGDLKVVDDIFYSDHFPILVDIILPS